jgi:hypothetical protein
MCKGGYALLKPPGFSDGKLFTGLTVLFFASSTFEMSDFNFSFSDCTYLIVKEITVLPT